MKGLREMTYDQLVEYTDEVIEELRKKAYREGYEQGRFDERMESGFKAVGKKVDEMGALKALGMDFFKKSPQEERDRIVERAKRDYKYSFKIFGYKEYSVKGKRCTAEYIVDREKRTVVVLMRSIMSNRVLSKGIAKCAPNDCFNVHIGKAIALRRALGLKVPSEYLYAPQPTEVRVGDIVKTKALKFAPWGNGKVIKIESDEISFDFRGYWVEHNRNGIRSYNLLKYAKIIDDSRDE